MQRFAFITLIILSMLLWAACTSAPDNTLYPDDEEILYIENDSLLNESNMEQEHVSRHHKLSKGYRRTFNDKNNVHLAMAQKYGIEPLQSLEEANSRQFYELARIDSCRYYSIKRLTHSAPYLTPRAKWMLMNIGKNFQDSLAMHGVDGYQIIVTSLLRTDDSIRRLRRRNSNASKNSAHRYGTTFDISYIHYNRTDSATYIPEYRLKETLAEVLYDLRHEGHCYVKYEVKQSCFHVTAW
ncbi:MAG: hypothetical protein IKJ79_07030 [Bacteroidaceae bacterium]|nr:hypothetical protein [Bacteroidaceae bacterium]